MDDRKERTLYCGNLSDNLTEELLYELFLQAGPLESVKIPKDKNGRNRNYAFITFKHEASVPYTVALMQGIPLFGREIRLELRTGAESARNVYLDAMVAHRQSKNSGRNIFSPFHQNTSPQYERWDLYKGHGSHPDAYDERNRTTDRWLTSTPVAVRGLPDVVSPLAMQVNGYLNGHNLSPHYNLNPLPYGTRVNGYLQDNIHKRTPYSPLGHMDSKISRSNLRLSTRQRFY